MVSEKIDNMLSAGVFTHLLSSCPLHNTSSGGKPGSSSSDSCQWCTDWWLGTYSHCDLKWKKIYYFQAPHSSVQSRCMLFTDQEHSIPILNESEKEKIREWNLGFVIAMETVGFFMTASPLQILSICCPFKSQTWLSQRLKIHLHRCRWTCKAVHHFLWKTWLCKQRGDTWQEITKHYTQICQHLSFNP